MSARTLHEAIEAVLTEVEAAMSPAGTGNDYTMVARQARRTLIGRLRAVLAEYPDDQPEGEKGTDTLADRIGGDS